MSSFPDFPFSSTVILLGTAFAVCAAAFLSWLLSVASRPGPWGVPILGYYPFLRKDFYVQLHELAKKHGEVYIINLAGQDFLYLDTIRAIREAHIAKAECFPSRSTKHSVLYDSLDKSLSFLDGEHWRVQRKFFVQSMRDIGLARNKDELKGPVESAIEYTLETFRASDGELIEIIPLMTKQCTDVILRLVLGNDITDEEAEKLNEIYIKILLPMSDKNLILVGSVAWFLILLRNRGYKEMLVAKEEMTALLQRIVDDHRATFDPNQQPRDFVDLYLQERWIREKKDDPHRKYFSDEILVSSLIQVYGDGSVTIGIFVALFLRELGLRPAVQDAVHEEIVQVIGRERLPTWNDRELLPFTNSVMKEILRSGKLSPVLPGLECAKETTVLGVRVPKGCITLINMWSAHNDPSIYENPERFDATRFMPDKPKVEPPVSFGVGRRACAGEGLVMAEMLLFITAILQNFSLVSEEVSGEETIEELMQCRLRAVPRPGGKYSSIP